VYVTVKYLENKMSNSFARVLQDWDLMAAAMKVNVLWGATPASIVNNYQHFWKNLLPPSSG
jgi:hypothetical protein